MGREESGDSLGNLNDSVWGNVEKGQWPFHFSTKL